MRGAASGDTEMRAIFDATRATMAQRIIGVLDQLGFTLSERAVLAVHGWVAYVEECVVRWIESRAPGGATRGTVDREQLLEMLTKSLPAVALSASDGEVGTLVQILTASEELTSG